MRTTLIGAAVLALTWAAWPQAQEPDAQPVQHPDGTLTPVPVDPGRPWGWAVKAFMDNPDRPLYNKAKAKLLSGEQVFSHTQSRFDPEQYCRMAPHYDYTWFEMQHSRLRFDQVEEMMRACPRPGAAPMIRMPDALEGSMQKAYDLGVLGTIVPMVDDVHKARDAARLARFPPAGRRSQGGSGFWDAVLNPGETYRSSVNDNILVAVMIETVEGVNNAYEIASTPGLDVVMMGNGDIESFSGYSQDSNEYQDMLTKVRDATYRAGKYWGNAWATYADGNRLSPDSRFHQNGPSNDGWSPSDP
jgi:2-keto-3-deoxy-L-rhamnonate aldolase RhmA